MARRKMEAEQIASNETIVLWKAKTPLTDTEHEQLSQKLRSEQEQSGVKIVLVPYSVDTELVEDQSGDGE